MTTRPATTYSSWLLLHGKDKTDESGTANTYSHQPILMSPDHTCLYSENIFRNGSTKLTKNSQLPANLTMWSKFNFPRCQDLFLKQSYAVPLHCVEPF